MNAAKKFIAAILTLVLCQAVVASAGEASNVSLGVAPSYSEGKYGTKTDTTIVYLPAILKVKVDDLSFKLTVPYIYVEAAPGTRVSGGMVIGPPMGPPPPGPVARTTESGLGDIWAEARYRIHGSGAMPDFIPYVKIKFGAASNANGLGTGENDYEGGLGLEWSIGDRLFPFVDGGYRVVGSPAGIALNDIATYDGGLMLKAGKESYLTGMLMGHQSEVASQAAALDAVIAWNYRDENRFGFQVFVDKGLSNGSPDFAVGINIEKGF